MKDRSDNELALAYLAGNKESFDILVHRYLQPIYFFCKTMVQGDETNDVVQEVFIKLWKNFKKYDKNKKFKSWLFMIARNTCLDHLRKKKPVLFSEMITDEGQLDFEDLIADNRPTPEEEFALESAKEDVETALSILPPATQVVFDLYYREQMSFQEISETLAISVNTAKSRHLRGIKALRTQFGNSKIAPK